MKKIIVIGGGAAGMMAAAAAGARGAGVTLLEKNEKLGKKLYITGKGRCNLTNDCERDTFFANVIHNPRFLYSAYAGFTGQDMQDWVRARGVPLKTERGGRVFPVSDKASDVTKALTEGLRAAGVKVRLGTEVRELLLTEGRCTGVRLADGRELTADGVIVATGGLSYPSTGSTGDGYRFAEAAGHSVTELSPGLVGLDAVFADGSPVKPLQGLSLRNIRVRAEAAGRTLYEEFGEMLFTEQGVSGPVILTMSSRISDRIRQGQVQLLIDFKPALTPEQLDRRLLREFEGAMNRQLSNVMRSLLPASAAEQVLRAAGLPAAAPVHGITAGQRAAIGAKLKAFPLRIMGLRGFREAIITQGGVSVKEIDPRTMESKRVKGLYFAGEVLDLDACTGGFNLQIAWSTGYAAGKGAADEVSEHRH